MVLDEEGLFPDTSEKERCIFETGIKLATAFHQFAGTPVSPKSKDSLETAIKKAIENQPYVEEAKVEIAVEKLNEYGYATLSGEMLDLSVTVQYGGFRCVGRMKYIKDYPLMYVESIETVKRG
ncbi:MAG: dihydroneopterin aldolase family protein [Candidatus Bathyarchaeia archaeon]